MAEDAVEDGWAVHEREQRRAWLKLTYAERLQWLEDAKRFVAIAHGAARKTRAAREPKKKTAGDP